MTCKLTRGTDSVLVEIPSKIKYEDKHYNVVEIDNHAFEDCIHIQKVVIPNSVTKLGGGVFPWMFCSERRIFT